jgi:ABC-type multidrug transport system fused ATPase/permease subunit
VIRNFIKLTNLSGSLPRFCLLLLLRCPTDAALTVTQALFLQRVFNSLETNDAAGLNGACVFFGAATLCVFIYNGAVWSIYAPFCVRLCAGLRVKLFETMTALRCSVIEAGTHGDWLTRLNTDVEEAFTSRPLHFPHFVCACVRIALSSVLLLLISPAVYGWVMLFVVPHVLFNQIFVARAMPELNRQSLEASARNTDGLTAFITCADINALYGSGGLLLKRFEQSSLALYGTNMKIHLRNAVSAAAMPFFGLSGYITLLTVSGGLMFGYLTAAFQYRGGILIGANMLINCVVSISASYAGVRRVLEVFEKSDGLCHYAAGDAK